MLPWVSAVPLVLTPEPTNPYDPDAIRVEFEFEAGRLFHLGYIPNSNCICLACGEHYNRFQPSCTNCSGEVSRIGTATWLKGNGFFDKGNVYAEVSEITGGGEGQSLGCNIEVFTDTDD